MYYRNEGGKGIGEKKKRKKRIFMELMACSLFRNSRLFLFFFFILLQMQIADYLPIVTLDRV